MAEQYYNVFESGKIFKQMESNPIQALNDCKRYIDKYPKDYSIYIYYIEILLILGRIPEAEKSIKRLEKVVYNDDDYNSKHTDRVYLLNCSLAYVKLKLLLLKEEYQEALDYGKEHKKELREAHVDAVFVLCKKRLGLPIDDGRDEYSYLYKQYADYTEEEFLDHIKKHFIEYDSDDTKVKSYFVPTFPIYEIIEEVKKYIPSDKVLHTGYGNTSYYFRYDGCGRYNKKVENYFMVVCIQGTNNIITIYPIEYGEDLPHVNLNYMISEEVHNDIKKDQVARFYKRFGKKESK